MSFVKKRKSELKPNGYKKGLFGDKKQKLANWLSHKTTGYSPLQKKTRLIGFSLLFCVAGLAVLTFHKNPVDPVFFHAPRTLPVPIERSGSQKPSMVSESDFIRLETGRVFLDSLKKYDSLKFKNIMLAQPGLLKSIQMLESIYQSQKNNIK